MKMRGRKMNLREYKQRYETIMNLSISPTEKDKMLSLLMTELENAFDVPMIKNEGWEKENPEVYALYFKVSASRSF